MAVGIVNLKQRENAQSRLLSRLLPWLMVFIPFLALKQTITDSIAQLLQIFRTMDGNRAQEIHEAYYKTVEGLMALARKLELADADLADSPIPLLDESMYAVPALEAMKHSQPGATWRFEINMPAPRYQVFAILFTVNEFMRTFPVELPV